MAVWGQSSPLVETSWSVYLDLSALLSDMEPTQVLPAREEIFKPAVIGYWGATGQKSSIRKMSSDFVESVERVPQRSQFAAAYGFWK